MPGPTIEILELAATTDVNGYIHVTFSNPIDQVMVTGNVPQSGVGWGIVSCTAYVDGPNTARVRVWVQNTTPDGGSVTPAANRAVTITLLGLAP